MRGEGDERRGRLWEFLSYDRDVWVQMSGICMVSHDHG